MVNLQNYLERLTLHHLKMVFKGSSIIAIGWFPHKKYEKESTLLPINSNIIAGARLFHSFVSFNRKLA